ncbi:hypothetical protein ILYODFUR_026713 [Ilyodon furcidens]|uniref:Uncharacterized protein n=1 Tax=Ilyodon furcidens TaxID=33524 RepID=A0ABV0TBP4_9TELE
MVSFPAEPDGRSHHSKRNIKSQVTKCKSVYWGLAAGLLSVLYWYDVPPAVSSAVGQGVFPLGSPTIPRCDSAPELFQDKSYLLFLTLLSER